MKKFTEWMLEKIDADPSLSVAGVAKAASMDNSAIRKMIERGGVPRLDNAVAIARALGTDLGEYLFGDGGQPVSNFPSIPRYDVHLSAGHGSFDQSEAQILDTIPFTEEFLCRRLGCKTTDGLICVTVRGESMEPTLVEGDLIIVNTTQKSVGAGVYAVNFNGESYVKRAEKIGEGFSLFSDHPAYAPISVQGDDLQYLDIIGKVVWAAKTDFRRP